MTETYTYTRSPELQAAFTREIIDDCKNLAYLEKFEFKYMLDVPLALRPSYTFEALTQTAVLLGAFIHTHADTLGIDYEDCMNKAREEIKEETKQMKKEVA